MVDFSKANIKIPDPLPDIVKEAADILKDSELSPEYPNVFPIKLPGGQLYIDSTPNKESILIRHKSGSFIQLESDGDIYIHSQKDLKVSPQRNFVIKVGDGNKEKAIIHVTGDAHMRVEGDLINEVGGNKYETISGNYNLNVKGTFSSAANTRNTKTQGKHVEKAHEIENDVTFIKNNVGIPEVDPTTGETSFGGEVRNIVFGNYVTEMVDPRSVFAVQTLGHINLTAAATMTRIVGGAYIGTVEGAYTEKVTGAANINVGGSLNINVGGVLNMNAVGIMKLTAAQIYLN